MAARRAGFPPLSGLLLRHPQFLSIPPLLPSVLHSIPPSSTPLPPHSTAFLAAPQLGGWLRDRKCPGAREDTQDQIQLSALVLVLGVLQDTCLPAVGPTRCHGDSFPGPKCAVRSASWASPRGLMGLQKKQLWWADVMITCLPVPPQLVAQGQFRVLKLPLGFIKVLQWVSSTLTHVLRGSSRPPGPQAPVAPCWAPVVPLG